MDFLNTDNFFIKTRRQCLRNDKNHEQLLLQNNSYYFTVRNHWKAIPAIFPPWHVTDSLGTRLLNLTRAQTAQLFIYIKKCILQYISFT